MSLPALGAGLGFLALAAITALFGFGAISDDAPLAAKVFSAFFLLSAAGAFWWSWLTRAPSDATSMR